MKGVFNISNTKSRKYQLTFNNPEKHSICHETIIQTMNELKWKYYCMCDEIGESNTPHTHLFFCCENAVEFNRVKKLFPTAHIETAKGTCQENRDYIRKEGRYLNSDKKDTNLIETFEEYGEIPLDRATKSESQSEQIFQMVKDGYSNIEIIERFPSAMNRTKQLDTLRKELLKEKNKGKRVAKNVVYITGETETGKTRFVLDKHGDENVFIVTDYKNPFDGYRGEQVILFDEFHSSLPVTSMLRYTDIYGCELPARYENTYANYDTVYIISNISLNKQYLDIDVNTFNAFLRRISVILQFNKRQKELPYAPENIEIIEIFKDEYKR